MNNYMNNDIKDQFKICQFFLQYKLDGIIRFYKYAKRLMAQEHAIFNKKSEENIPQELRRILTSKKFDLGWYREMLIHNSFLMIHSQLEETLAIILRYFSTEQAVCIEKEVCKKSDITRFKDSFLKNHGIKLNDFHKWSFLVDCSKVRNLLLHANGNVFLAKNQETIVETCKRLGSNVEIRNSQIVIQEQLLQKFADALAEITEFILLEVRKKV